MAFAAPLAIGTGITQLASGIMAGRAAKADGKARQEELEREAQLAETAAKESGASRLEELNRTVGAIRALTGARNINPDSPSAMALEDTARKFSDRDRQREGFNVRQSASNLRLTGAAAKKGGQQRATAYYLQGGSSFLKSVSDVYGAKGG